MWPKEDGTPTPKYRTVEVYFPDYYTAAAAVTTPAAQAVVTDVFRLGAPVTMLFSEVRTSTTLPALFRPTGRALRGCRAGLASARSPSAGR